MRGSVLVVVASVLLAAGCSSPEESGPPTEEPSGQRDPAPVLGASHKLFPDPVGEGVLLVTGPPEGEPSGDPLELWRWDGTAWSTVAAAGEVPPARSFFAGSYDAGREVVVLYGGDVADEESATVWEWDGRSWTSQETTGPGPRLAAGMTYDADEGVSLLYGGDASGEISGATWSWDGTRWQLLARRGPTPPRWPAAMVDGRDGGPLLVGGHQVADEDLPPALGDTWTWDDGWTVVSSAGDNELLVNAEAIDHPELGTLLVGGSDLERANGDVLRWTGTAWEMLAEDVFPERQAFGLAYDAGRDVVVLTGGVVEPGSTERHQDLWEWSGDPAEPAVRVVGGGS